MTKSITAEGMRRYPHNPLGRYWITKTETIGPICTCLPSCLDPCNGTCGCEACCLRFTLEGYLSDTSVQQMENDEIETVAKAIYLSFFLPDWPPEHEVDLGMDAEAFRRAARNVLQAQRGGEPNYKV